MHQSVLFKEIIHAMLAVGEPDRKRLFVDCTVGAGGHAAGILEATGERTRLLGFDLDPQALALASERLAPFGDRVILKEASYTAFSSVLEETGWPAVDGVVLDLGVSSMQFDTAERGFSFRFDAPLDMRFGPSQQRTAADLVNFLSEQDLADIIYRYGEERKSRQIARAIVNARPLQTTAELAQIVSGVVRGGKIHPATRTFQALRIATNDELGALENVLPQITAGLAPGGRVAVISFHSLEDRIVKNYFRQESRDCICPPSQPVCTCGHKATLHVITRKPIQADAQEISKNPRARSAKLRIAERLKQS